MSERVELRSTPASSPRERMEIRTSPVSSPRASGAHQKKLTSMITPKGMWFTYFKYGSIPVAVLLLAWLVWLFTSRHGSEVVQAASSALTATCTGVYDTSSATLRNGPSLISGFRDARSSDRKYLSWGSGTHQTATWHLANCKPGTYTLRVGYALPVAGGLVHLKVNGVELPFLKMPAMTRQVWGYADVTATLTMNNEIELICDAKCPPIDVLTVRKGVVPAFVEDQLPESEQQPTRLRITNKCSYPMWVQSSDNMPNPADRLVYLVPDAHRDYTIPDAGLASTRFHPKVGCDSKGENCQLGSVGEPPVDSKLEATWGCLTFDTDRAQCAADSAITDTTWWNLSQVDGYTIPYLVKTKESTDPRHDCPLVDCGDLDLANCPKSEDLSQGFTQTYPDRKNLDLRIFDKFNPKKVIGCIAPCYKLNFPSPWGLGLGDPAQDGLAPYCCPTPPVSPEKCSAGPVEKTKYVAAIHKMCPDVYAYAYDDRGGLHTCASGAKLELVFCPRGDKS